MIIKLFILSIMIDTLSARNIAATTQDIRAFILPKDSISLRGSLNATNGSLDFFNLNQTNNGNDIYSALGNSSGLDLSLAYGIHKHVSLYYNFQGMNIDYAGEKLKNRHNDLYARINFYDNPQNLFDDLSLDVGFIRDFATDFNPQMADLSNNSYYLRLIAGSRMNDSLFNLYSGFKYTSIDTTLFNQSANRNEKALTLGMTNTVEFSRYILDTNYEYIRLFDRDTGLGESKSNHIFKINLARTMSDDLLLYIGTTIMTNQFNGLIPYLYNAQTQSAFDKTYNYLSLGFVYNFPVCYTLKPLK